jgi:hypothetical protein
MTATVGAAVVGTGFGCLTHVRAQYFQFLHDYFYFFYLLSLSHPHQLMFLNQR